ncbi:T9SS type B sorting domain-containing protein [Aestuariibaculum sediminum]|uniref:T9SS type B sorting domain-containing protein n=1 Tax=Aestuariibaculum sediminum TaxID=2770637 RepID=A0A8J6UFW3_9FLAO|nr:T9SS type B sorting domain-containing protein [Aestuariibaculum sediminum]MBD0831736.1 T9SS type B sorting domain-containing protein [Aestuariibaculum sediminum]
MKNFTFIKPVLVILILLLYYSGTAQTYKAFSVREKVDVRGSMLVIGNSILGENNQDFNDFSRDNQDIDMQYIDIDGDASTFSSSSADLLLMPHEDGSATTCYRVAFAGLYWSAVLKSGENRSNITNAKFKVPGSSTYTDISGELIYDAIASPIVSETGEPGNTPYACFADVTDIVSSLTDIEGTYTMADVVSSEGFNNSTGLSAGWSLIIIYEDPELHTKSFTLFDGFSHIYDGHQETIPVTGFRTPPSGPVDLQFAYGALDGDRTKRATKLEINGKEVTTDDRSANKFFGSVIENFGFGHTPNPASINYPRVPNSENTLGYDTGLLEIQDAEPEFIGNDDTSADFRLQVARGQADPVFAFFSAFAVDVISPDIELIKTVEDTSGDDIDGADVYLGQQLFYEITYQSTGNDNVIDFTIKDVLPDNIVFDPNDVDLTNAGGATIQSYDPDTRTIIFAIPNSSVEVNDPVYTIRIPVQIVPNCYDLSQACSNEIQNQAFGTYTGEISGIFIQDEGSFASEECLGVPGSTNFLVDISNCEFKRTEVLCGSTVVLTAADGYDSYSWSTDPSGTPVVGTGQTYTANGTGTYYVQNTTSSTCISIQEEITVIPYGNTITNPIIPYADLLPICPNDGKVLPYIFLCGANDIRNIQTGISDAVSINWQKLDEASCDEILVDDCANENEDCTWNTVTTGPDFIADDAGQFRIVINYPGGCFSIFYFNVYQNLLEPTITAKDIICTTPGEVRVGGVPSGYEYSLDPNGPYQTSNVFTINTPGYYTAYIRQVGVDTNPCIFQTPEIYVRNRDANITEFVTQPNCNGDKGTIKLAVNDALPQYYYSLSSGGTVINSVGPIMDSDYTFGNLNAGTYTYDISTDDGCVFTGTIEIIEPDPITVTSAITKPLTCTDGEITVYPVGGTPPYQYFVNGNTISQDSPVIAAPTPGTYEILVLDVNNCSAITSQTIEEILPPEFSVNKTDILCNGENTGSITFNVTNANGYSISYSIDNGNTYSSNPSFYNLPAGTYPTLIEYTLDGEECFSVAEDIIITETPNAVTASGGVSELAGCGPNGEGRVRITNPQGGTPPYEYSFDNQISWTTDNEAYVAPGTYTLYIRDANGCIFAMPGIVLEPEPEAPSISISDVDYNCDGTGNTTVTVNNSSSNSYSYGYLIDGVENPNVADPQTFLDVSEGSHTITVTYQLETVPTFSNLLNEDFGSGAPTTTSGIASAYCFNDQRVNGPYPCGTRSVEDNQYSVASFFWRSDDPNANNTGAWYHFSDHTTNGADPDGRFLLVNIGSAAGPYGILYSKPINDVIPNQDIKVDLYVANLMRTVNADRDDPDFRIQLVDGAGNVIAEDYTGIVPKNEQWNFRTLTLNPGNNTDLTFVIRSGSVQYYGNDALIDDISVYQLPKTCIEQVDFPFIIDPGQAFAADIVSTSDVTCASAGDGTITIAAQNFDTTNGYQYSIDGGTTWNTTTSSPFTISGLTEGTYNVIVRYDASSDGVCDATLQAQILAPDALQVNADTTPVTCLDGSTVTASATGGTPAYTFELLDATMVVINTFPGNGILTNIPAGDYTVRVTDSNGCAATTPISLLAPTSPTASIVNADYCYDAANGATLEIAASGGNPPYEYSVNGGAFQSSPIFANLTPGTYDFIVRDAYGCEFPLTSETIANQVNISANLTKELDCTVSPDAEISGTVSEGYPPYTVTLIQGSGTVNQSGNTFSLSTGVAGDYQFQVTDDNGCIAVSNVITVNPIENPTATTTVINPLCNGSSDGSVQIVPAGGVGPYTYSFDGSAFSSTSLYSGLAAGTYNYEIQDANECIFSGSVTLTEPTTLVVNATATTFSCAADNTAQSATVTIDVPTTGTAPYLYSFNASGYSASNTLEVNDNGTNQTINYSVQDANGCTANGSLIISALNPPTDLDFSATTVTCINTTSTVTVTATDGAGSLTYEIIAPITVAPQSSNTFSGLAPDTYVFRVTDENDCYYDESFVIDPVTPIAITGTKLSDVLCFGGNDGAAQFEVFNSTGFTYTVNGGSSQAGSSPINLSNLVAGSYVVEVTDTTTGCTADTTVTILEPTDAVSVTASTTNVNCNNFNSQITAIPAGGTPSYTYAVVISGNPAPANSDYASGNIITVDTNSGTNLVWDVYIRDANGCTSFTTVTIVNDPLPTVTAPTVDNQCTASSGFTFTVSASSGVPPYSYSINGGVSYQSSSTFTVNAAGSYTVMVRDANGCTATASTTTEVFAPITASAALTKDITCSSPMEASIDITVSGGNTPYTYEVSTDGGTTYTNIAGATYTTSVAGTYQFRVTDANGCTEETQQVTTNPVINITADVISNDPTCNGYTDGSIQFNPTAGEAPFEYSIDGGTTFVSTNVFGGLTAGTYNYVVRDSKGCELIDSVTLIDPPAIVANIVMNPIVCNANTPGSFDVSVTSGGTAPYTYYLYDRNYTELDTHTENSAATTPVHSFTGLNFGDYYITIIDANGCEFNSGKLRIETQPYLEFEGIVDVNSCATGVDYEVETTGGTGPYTYSILGQLGTEFGPTANITHVFTGLVHGVTYYFQVEDVNGCISILEATMPPPPSNIAITGTIISDVNCFGDTSGGIDFTVQDYDGSVTDINYQVLDALTLNPLTPAVNGTLTGTPGGPVSGNVSGLPAGSYVIQATEVGGTACSNAFTFDVTQPTQPLSAAVSNVVNANCNSGAQLTITATGGTGPYQYAVGALGFSPAPADFGANNVLVLDPSIRTNWDIVVQDANGCTVRLNEDIATDDLPTIAPVTEDCFTGIARIVTLSGTTFNGNRTYNVNGGAYQSSADFTITAAGTYTFNIKDDNGCIASTVLVVNPPILLDAALDLDLTCTNDAEITITPSGGSGTYNLYEVSTDNILFTAIGGTTYTTSTAGMYYFRVTDDEGCSAVSNAIEVSPITSPTLTYTQLNVTCNGSADGSIIVTAADGIAPYEYRISSNGGLNWSVWQATNVFSGLSAGTYEIQIRDNKECVSGTDTVTITEPTLVDGTIDLTQGLTCGASNATQPALITVNGSGGTAPYTYSFDGVNYTSTNTYATYSAGIVNAWIKDANGCTIAAPLSFDMPALSVPTDLVFNNNPITCNDPTTDVTLTATGGVGVLSYEIISPSAVGPQASNEFTGLALGTYVFTVTDENGCYYTESYTIAPVTNITVSGQLINDALCTGDANGIVEYTVANFSGTYSYNINGGGEIVGQTNTTVSITGVPSGDQTITVTDEVTGCTDTFTVTVSEPTPVSLAEIDKINANCNFGAQVTVEASGGTPPYQYAFVIDNSAPVTADYSNSNTAVLDPATSTNWDVWVMDANGCTDQIDVVITTDPLPSVTVPALSDNQCNLNGDPFTFTVTNPTGIAPFSYSIGNGYQTSPTFTVSTPGTYNVTIKDGNGCTYTDSTPIEVYPALDLNVAVATLPSCSDNDGVITVTGAGGSGNYSYAISPIVGTISGNVISGVPAGTYTVTITDIDTGCDNSASITLAPPTPVTFTATSTDVTCNGNTDGTITVELPASNDNPIYTYEIIAPISVAPQTSNVFTGLAPGTYTVRVVSGRNCEAQQDVVVGEPDAIVVPSPTVVEYACTPDTNAVNFASITVSGVTGGSNNYVIYEFFRDGNLVQSGANNVYNEADFLGGNYTINVYDENGCSGTTTAVIAPFVRIDAIDVAINNAITCINDEDITVSATTSGGIANLQFTVEDTDGTTTGAIYNQTNRSGVFTGLPVGNYIITVYNVDTGCSLQTVHYVNNPNTFELDIESITDVTCFSDNDGSVTFTLIDNIPTPVDDAGPFDYEVYNTTDLTNPVQTGSSPDAGPITITGLASGTYTINATLTNAPYCLVTTNVTITAPNAALAIDSSHTDITCIGNDGTITITGSGGWPGDYEYQLELNGGSIISAFSNTYYFEGLSAGIYTASVRDSQGCIVTEEIELIDPLPIDAIITPSTTMLSCFGDKTASITVTNILGGQGGNYMFTLNMVSPVQSSSGPQSSNVFSGLGAGTYNVTVSDGFTCETTFADITISEPDQIVASLVRATTQTCTTDATLTLSATGGTGAYEYSDDESFTNVINTFTSDITFSVAPGTYRYYVRDANGCVSAVSNDIVIEALPDLVVTLDTTNATINCAGDSTGVIVAEAEGGLGNYVYTLQDASGNDIPDAVQDTPGVFTQLPIGTYQVLVESGDCLVTSAQVTITEPNLPLEVQWEVSDVTCNGSNDGILEITATGGSGIIKYAISPQMNQFFDEPIFDNLAPGDYQAIVQDQLGCYVLFDFTIDQPDPQFVNIVPNSLIPVVCEGDANGEFSIEITGGTPPFRVALDNIDGPYTQGADGQTLFTFNNLDGQDKVVYVIDSQDCQSEWNIEFPDPVLLNPVAIVDFGCENNISTNTVTVYVDDSNTDLSQIEYALDGGAYQSSNVFVNVPPGIGHYIDVRHSNGCIKQTEPFDIEAYEPLQLAIQAGETINTIEAMATGGTGDYEFFLNGESYGTETTFIYYETGNYTVTVVDSNGCTAVASGFFEYIDVCISNYFTPNGDGNMDEWGPGCTDQYKDLTFDIYDRYGRVVAKLKAGQKWDGKYEGRELPTGDYWFVVKLNDPKDDRDFVGHFTLYR